MKTVHCTLNNEHCTLYTVRGTLYTEHCTLDLSDAGHTQQAVPHSAVVHPGRGGLHYYGDCLPYGGFNKKNDF